MDNLTDDQRREFQEAFSLFDRNGNGTISSSDLRYAIRALGQMPSDAELERITRDVDQHAGGAANLNYFFGIMGKLIGEGDSEEDLVAAFALFDKENTGYISVDDFRHYMSKLGDPLPNSEVDKMLQVAGVSDGWVDYRTWVRVNAHDVEGLLATCDANIVHRFGGEHALGGTRHGKEHLKLWFERLGRLAPNLKLTVTDVWVKGWPWDTTVIIRWTATETQPLPDDSTYANHGVHIVKLRYGKALSIDANEDSLAVHRMLELRAKHGSEEALAAPIEN